MKRNASHLRAIATLGLSALALSATAASAAPTDPDHSFGKRGAAKVSLSGFDDANGVVAEPDGRVVAVGRVSSTNGDNALAFRVRGDGSFDNAFSGDGINLVDSGGDESASAVALQSDGRLVVAGSTTIGKNGALYRLKPNGELDSSFDGDGALGIDSGAAEQLYDVDLQPDGKIVATGLTSAGSGDAAVYRVKPNGELDKSFDGDGAVGIDSGGVEAAFASAIQPDGKIVVVGTTSVHDDAVVYRLKPNGELDKSFDGDGALGIDKSGRDRALDVAVQPDGKIVVAGDTSHTGNGYVMRLNANGSPDTSFSGDGTASIDAGGTETASTLTLQPDGKILGGGYTTEGSDGLVFRLNRDGSPDRAFAEDGVQPLGGSGLSYVNDIETLPNGKIVLAGDAIGDTWDAVVLRLQGDSPTTKPSPTAKGARCGFLRATIVGTPKSDRIRGTRGRDVIFAGRGNDRVSALDSRDVVCGGAGDDVLRGGRGRDTLRGGPGRDTLIGGPGKDKLVGGPGRDTTRQ